MEARSALRLGALALPASALVLFACVTTGDNGNAGEHTYLQYNDAGALIRPDNYREWVFVGTPLTPNDLNDGQAAFPEFHNVYIDPTSWEHFERTGDFRDGTILVKELVSVDSKQAVSGNGYFMGDFIGLEAAVKSSVHHPDEPGNWAYFSFGHEYPLASTAAAFPSESCNACHEGVAANDFVFTQHYPVLRDGGGLATELGASAAEFNSDGEMLRPKGYRRWVYVGTPVTPNDMNDGKAAFPELHSVYIDPESWAHWKEHGEFRDGTTIVKELTGVGATHAVSGRGYFMGDFTGLEATVKSSEQFPDEPGNWAYFSFGAGEDARLTARAFASESCNSCHAANAADDFVFTQYYPVLTAAKKGRAMEPMGKPEAVHDGPDCEQCLDALETVEAEKKKDSGTPESVDGLVPADPEELFQYLTSGAYKSFVAKESAAHPSAGPHTKFGLPVRVFLDPKMAASLEAGNKEHPEGASIVKEMFDADNNLEGWAVLVNTQDESDGGDGIYWYEVTSITDGSNPVASGNGLGMCVGCHSSASDFVITKFPLE